MTSSNLKKLDQPNLSPAKSELQYFYCHEVISFIFIVCYIFVSIRIDHAKLLKGFCGILSFMFIGFFSSRVGLWIFCPFLINEPIHRIAQIKHFHR